VRNTHWRDDQTLLERAVVDFPESFNARHELGKRYIEQGRTDRAIIELRAANRLLPNIPPNVSLLARALIIRGRGAEAVVVLQRAVKELGPQRELVELLRRARSE
jgi:predicted Zn-dependent protease